jgi:Holliday junction resolvase RusA-like endonuclease
MAKELKFVLTGRTPSKKNSRRSFYNKNIGHILNYYSPEFKKWNAEKLKELESFTAEKVTGIVSISFEWYMPDNRKADTNNKEESILDLLVDAGIIEDDKWQIVKERHSIAMGIDKEHPRVHINIVSLE